MNSIDDQLNIIEKSIKDLYSLYLSELVQINGMNSTKVHGITQIIDKYIDNELNKLKNIKDQYNDFNKTFLSLSTSFIEQLSNTLQDSSKDMIGSVHDDLESILHQTEEQSDHLQLCLTDLNDNNKRPMITFKNNNKKFKIDESIVSLYPHSLQVALYQNKSCRNNKGDLFVDKSFSYYEVVQQYLKEDTSVSFDQYSTDEKAQLIEEFEFFQVPFKSSLLNLRQSYEEFIQQLISSDMLLLINGKKNEFLESHYDGNQKIELLKCNMNHISYNDEYKCYALNLNINNLDDILDYYKWLEKHDFSYHLSHERYSLLVQNLNILHIPLDATLEPVLFPSSLIPSLICSNEFDSILKEWFPHSTFQLLYRASEHFLSPFSFHEYCDDKGPTLILYRDVTTTPTTTTNNNNNSNNSNNTNNSNNNTTPTRHTTTPTTTTTTTNHNKYNIFGGYTSQSWHNSYFGDFVYDSESFIFSLQNQYNYKPCRYKVIEPEHALFCCTSYGPTFGYDIVINNNNTDTSFNFAQTGVYYEQNDTYGFSLFVNTNKQDRMNSFVLGDYEVYKVIKQEN